MRVPKPLVFVTALTPAAYLAWAAFTGNLSANPLGDITNDTGDWALRFLCITLAITPLRRVSGWNGAIKFRRMLGLFAFFYGGLGKHSTGSCTCRALQPPCTIGGSSRQTFAGRLHTVS